MLRLRRRGGLNREGRSTPVTGGSTLSVGGKTALIRRGQHGCGFWRAAATRSACVHYRLFRLRLLPLFTTTGGLRDDRTHRLQR